MVASSEDVLQLGYSQYIIYGCSTLAVVWGALKANAVSIGEDNRFLPFPLIRVQVDKVVVDKEKLEPKTHKDTDMQKAKDNSYELMHSTNDAVKKVSFVATRDYQALFRVAGVF